MADFLRHEPCPKCGSSNALARYDDGSAHCFKKCGYNEPKGSWGNGESSIPEEDATSSKDFKQVFGETVAIPGRALTEETCKHWGYQVGEHNGKKCHIATYRDSKGNVVAQKIRLPGKNFLFPGGKNAPFYGQWLHTGGKHLVITEGEIDALSMSQAFDNKWPVVSLPTGAQSAETVIEQQYEWLQRFERIVLMFDMDGPGQEAAEKVAMLLPPGKVCIAELPCKDANDVLKEHGKAKLIDCFWKAPEWRPDGIVSGESISVDELMEAIAIGYDVPLPMLQEKTYGLRKAEITLLTAGSGIGKSTWARELAYHLHQQHGLTIGNVYLEEGVKKTAQGYVAIHNNVPLGQLRAKKQELTRDQWEKSVAEVVHQRMHFYDHFGSLESENLIAKLRYMAVVCKCDFIILDHISIVVSGQEGSGQGERKDIDKLMTDLRSLAEATGVGLIVIAHLKRTQGKTFNEGDQVSLSDLRGSASLEQLSDNVWALERDQQADGVEAMLARIRVLKERETGDTGEADLLQYNRNTGRLLLADSECPFDAD